MSLAWSARVLLGAGKKEAALRLFGQALSAAARSGRARAAPPRFHDDQAVRQLHGAGARREGGDLDVGADAARHRQDAEGREVDRLDAVVQENPELHRPSLLLLS